MIIVLVVAVSASIVALFMRGFQLKDLKTHLTTQSLETPAMRVWLIKSQPYDDKMKAYKAGINSYSNGLGVYVICDNNQWYWVAGAYTTQDEAKEVIQKNEILKNTSCILYEIKTKNFKIDGEAIMPCRQIFESGQKVVQLLFGLRTTIQNEVENKDLLLEIIAEYNKIKNNAEELQKLNTTLKSDLIASVLYTANVNILSLQDIVFANGQLSISTVNTALLKIIFSVDNF